VCSPVLRTLSWGQLVISSSEFRQPVCFSVRGNCHLNVPRPAKSLRVEKGWTYVTKPSLPPLREYVQLLDRIWASRILTNNGLQAVEFERRLREYLRGDYVNVVANGTLALQLALRATVKAKRSVITTPFTFPATTTALIWEGYSPVFADIDPETFNLDPHSVEGAITEEVGGILSVHVFGNPAGSDKLESLARRRGVPLIFDGAHAFGVRTSHGSLFTRGNATTLSFHATKGFHTFEGGAVVTRSHNISRQIQLLRNFGIASEEQVEVPGINAKMNEAQAALGILNLRYIDKWIDCRRVRYELYRDLFSGTPGVQLQQVIASRYNYSYMPILLPSRRIRDLVFKNLLRNRIRPRKYFWPLTSAATFSRKYRKVATPIARNVSSRIITLPIFPDLPLSEVQRITRCVQSVLRETTGR
jgi:dTDP-4-amino-4,6-dideoxygalactose transaminase